MLKNRHGFTLIELLIVVVIIGILAAIAIPKFGNTREKAYVSAMKSDLRNLSTAQEIFYTDNSYNYSADPAELNITASDGVTLGLTTSTDPDSWQATATHSGTSTQCGVYVGYASTPITDVTQPNVVTCW